MKDSAFAEAKDALIEMACEADELQEAVGGSITDAVAGWLAPQYALAARERLAELKGDDRLKLLRTYVQDWALLRHGDQTAERLLVEREWLALEERAYLQRFKRKTVAGMEAIYTYVQEHPKAKAAFDAFWDEVRNPFDPSEQNSPWEEGRDEPIRPNPTESDR